MSEYEPELFGKYYLVDKVATGGMAEIFRAKTFSTAGFEKLQVIKRILSHLSDNEEFVSMFIDEAKISVSLQHANLVQIYDFGKIRDNYFIAMEWIDGKDVKQVLRKLAMKRRLMPEEFAVFIAHEVCKALDYAHKKTNLQGEPLGIIHRDMSPSNVLVSYSGEVKVADFGIAKAEMSTYDTKDGVLKGKFEYMSPEQARGDDISQQSDLFSVGIILYEMLTGKRLFRTDNEIKTLEKIKAVDIGPPSTLNPNVPKRLDDLVMKALTADLNERYADARAFQQALLEYMYPQTPPVIQRSLALWMEQLFTDERADERARLEVGTRMAIALHEERQAAEAARATAGDWDESPSSASSLRTDQRRGPPVVLMGLIAVLLVVVGVLAVQAFTKEDPQVVEVKVSPTTGALLMRIRPVGAKVYADGKFVGEGAQVDVGELPPGEMLLKFVADGYQTVEENVEVVAGERLVLPITLTADKVEVPDPPEVKENKAPKDPTPAPAAKPAKLSFTSSPSGASVSVDGKTVGTTPVTWDGALTGRSYKVRYTLDGHEGASFTATAPSAEGATESFSRSLTKVAPKIGKVSITLSAANRWAHIYVDGKQIGQTPKFNHELSVGKHEVRVLNEAIGLDETKSVTVAADETARLIFDIE
ncbi:MAG: serine/threonine protein kinase [Alphaproteobacteria bacterium]|nr:serine/threonine protein kinase [Alphaproteobacteria bacterium]